MFILVGPIEGGVETTNNVAGVEIAIADVDRVCMCSLGHRVVSKICVEGSRNGTVICRGIGEFVDFLWPEMEKAGRCGLVWHNYNTVISLC